MSLLPSHVTINLNVHVHHHPPEWEGPLRGLMVELKEQIVSALSDAIAALNASADNLLAHVKTKLDADQAEMARLQKLVDEGGATQADIQALADAKAKFDAADPTNPAVIPTPVPEPAPVTGP